mmetsp:Transcript_13670/g.51124  ORF Transcript_13670/g.51124 Transcript_13670/m.51124 type:complete len:268 (+) Transcript_13670:887-1690(+)
MSSVNSSNAARARCSSGDLGEPRCKRSCAASPGANPSTPRLNTSPIETKPSAAARAAARAASPTPDLFTELRASTNAPASRAWLLAASLPRPFFEPPGIEPLPPNSLLPLPPPSQSSQSSQTSSLSFKTCATWRLLLAQARNRCRNVTASAGTLECFIWFRTFRAASKSPAVAHACNKVLYTTLSRGMFLSRMPCSASPAAPTSPARAYAASNAMNECKSGSTPLSIISRIMVSTRITACCAAASRWSVVGVSVGVSVSDESTNEFT